MWVAHRHAREMKGTARDRKRMIEPGRVRVQWQVLRGERRGCHLYRDRLATRAIHDDAGMRPCQGVDRHVERRLPGAPCKMQRRTSNSVAAHPRHRAIRVDHVHRWIIHTEGEHTVSPNTAMPIAKRNRLLGRELHPTQRFLLDNEKVVPEPFILIKRQNHRARVVRPRLPNSNTPTNADADADAATGTGAGTDTGAGTGTGTGTGTGASASAGAGTPTPPRQHLRGLSCVDWRAPPQGQSEEYYRTPQRSPEEESRQSA